MKTFLFAALIFLCFPALAAEKESTYDRVMRTGIIRCGYVPYPPAVMKDPNTGAFSGILVDVMGEVGHLLSLDVEWTEELGWATTVEALKSGRVDAICVGFWQNPAEGKYVGFTNPMWYSAVNAYVRNADNRFDSNPAALDSPDIRVSAIDGEMSGIIARQDFPKAKILSKPNMANVTDLLLDVTTDKADVAFVETYLAEEFLANNPGTLKNVTGDSPLRVFGNTIALPMGDVPFQSMLNSALVQIVNSGQMEKILTRHEKYPGSLYRVAKTYEIAR